MKTLPNHVIAIDPGTEFSGVCLVRTEDFKPLFPAKLENKSLYPTVMRILRETGAAAGAMEMCQVVIERMYNPMSAGSSVFLACEWIGRFDVLFHRVFDRPTAYVFRYNEYRALCGKEYPHNDKGIKSALVDRFAYGQSNYGKGTKKAPGWFYGFAADAWSAYAIAVTHIDILTEAVNG